MDWYFLDACSLLNLYATGRLSPLAQALNLTFSVLPVVYPNESQFVYTRHGLTKGEALALDLTPEIQTGLVRVEADLTPFETGLFIQLASAGIDDGEAMTAAAAITRGSGIVSDDRKAVKVIQGLFPNTQIIGSLGLLRRWVEHQGIGIEETQELLLNLEIGGNYIVGKRDPEWLWYQAKRNAKT